MSMGWPAEAVDALANIPYLMVVVAATVVVVMEGSNGAEVVLENIHDQMVMTLSQAPPPHNSVVVMLAMEGDRILPSRGVGGGPVRLLLLPAG